MPRTRPPYPQKFRDRIVELARNGRTPSELADEFEPTETTIRNWIKQADRDEGKSADGLSTDEREELRELRNGVCEFFGVAQPIREQAGRQGLWIRCKPFDPVPKQPACYVP